MPSRLKRYQQAGDAHFVTFSCYHRLPYLNVHARIVFEEVLERTRQSHGFQVFGFVSMPEHVDLLLSEPERQPLANTFRVLKGETSKQLKGNHAQFWQRRYYDFNVSTHARFV
jgi:putative transposase